MDPAPRSTDPRQRLGRHGERLAARWYRDQGYLLLDANWRCPDGELDLVLARDDTVVFCEVKTRNGSRFGTAAEAVTPRKQARVRRLATTWLRSRSDRPWPRLRFDVAAIDRGRLEVVEGAF
ncbi:MAG: YraN family protein [Acidimicrobiales bacterium]|nr:YraN family protein [Acidimicrobiales bacterium]